jgi:hypothetical protein
MSGKRSTSQATIGVVGVLRQKSSRGQVEAWLATCQACVGAQHLSRSCNVCPRRPTDAGEIRAPLFEGQKKFRDAEAIAEAVQLPTMKLSYTG